MCNTYPSLCDVAVKVLPGITLTRIDWQDARNKTLETADFDIFFTKDVRFSFGLNKQAITLTDDVAEVKVKVTTCLTDPDNCGRGFNFRVNLKVDRFAGVMPLVGGGGDNPHGMGLAVVFMYGKMQVRDAWNVIQFGLF